MCMEFPKKKGSWQPAKWSSQVQKAPAWETYQKWGWISNIKMWCLSATPTTRKFKYYFIQFNFRIVLGKLRKKPGKKIALSLILSQKTLEKYRKDAAKSRKGYLLMKGMLIESKKKLLRWLWARKVIVALEKRASAGPTNLKITWHFWRRKVPNGSSVLIRRVSPVSGTHKLKIEKLKIFNFCMYIFMQTCLAAAAVRVSNHFSLHISEFWWSSALEFLLLQTLISTNL